MACYREKYTFFLPSGKPTLFVTYACTHLIYYPVHAADIKVFVCVVYVYCCGDLLFFGV